MDSMMLDAELPLRTEMATIRGEMDGHEHEAG